MLAASSVRAGRYAAMDLGTVTCRLLVTDVDERGIMHERLRAYDIVNLGEGVDSSKSLRRDAIERAATTLGSYRKRLDALEADDGIPVQVAAFATSAARDASNSAELIARIAQNGVSLRVIPGKEEASLSFAGASMDYSGEDLLVVDVGGGSTEVVAGKAGADPVRSRSFDVGCRRMTERFLREDPPSREELDAAKRWVINQMQPYFAQLREEGISWSRLVAVAGTATTVVSVQKHMEVYDSALVHGSVVTAEVLGGQLAQLASVPLAQRCGVVGLDPKRAPVIVAGLLILSQVLTLAEVASYTASETDILHGVVMAQARGEW
ncbi:MAG TPA: Ppx/GppA family phosphatase [Candidatus Aphodovivens excrementavium]|nr:Ppx/GppA family phosphatase [Candidatus Aphodovivens excrementavium]